MVKVALFVRLEAKPGKEKDVESFLLGGLPLVEEEPATTAWFGIRLGPSTFGIFDAFPDEAGRRLIFRARSRRRLWQTLPSYLPNRHQSRRLTSLRPS